jgi:hypothetical protein
MGRRFPINGFEPYFSDLDRQEARELGMDIIRFCLVMYRVHAESGELDCAQSISELENKAAAVLLAS